MPLLQSVHDLQREAAVLRRRPYGVICMEDEHLRAIHLRPWPYAVSLAEILLWGLPFHDRAGGNRCWLYYNQPCRHRRFLTLQYVVSSREATLKTFRGSLIVLDEIARLKGSDAIVCEVRNRRISERLLQRWGWEAHVPTSRRRHYIKRFYGRYPDAAHAHALMR